MLLWSSPSDESKSRRDGGDRDGHGFVDLPIDADPALSVAERLEDQVRGGEREVGEGEGGPSHRLKPPIYNSQRNTEGPYPCVYYLCTTEVQTQQSSMKHHT